jgi:predicted nuclease of predicted toxin-antitoxin system
MKIKFQADADLNEDIVTGVLRRLPEIDFQTATEAGFEGLQDENVLEIASRENRILVTHDRRLGILLTLSCTPNAPE